MVKSWLISIVAWRPNIMEVLRLCKIIVVPKASSNLKRNVKLVMEIICSQKFTKTQSKNLMGRSFQFNKFVLNRKSKKNTKYVTYLAWSILRGHTMYNSLENFVTIISFYEVKCIRHVIYRFERNYHYNWMGNNSSRNFTSINMVFMYMISQFLANLISN